MRTFVPALALIFVSFLTAPSSDRQANPEKAFQTIDERLEGSLGVYVYDTAKNQRYTHNADRDWYLASTIKIPLAIAVLQRVEAGELSLDDTVTLRASDFVDGAGDLLHQQPGTEYTIESLIGKMIRNSDSVATDMLLRIIGVDSFNEQIQEQIPDDGLGRITSILQVRYEAYGIMHEDVEHLSNTDILELRSAPLGPERREMLVQKIGIDQDDLQVPTIWEAFEEYYESDLNSGRLDTMGHLLEKLVSGELLSEEYTAFLLQKMENVTTGTRRIKAGLPPNSRFAHKTGTQVGRACNMGIVFPNPNTREEAVVVTACVKRSSLSAAEGALKRVGQVLGELIQEDT